MYIYIFLRCPHEFTIIPILVGSLSNQKEKQYGEFFSKYLNDPDNFFVISSDFCHWGKWCSVDANEVNLVDFYAYY